MKILHITFRLHGGAGKFVLEFDRIIKNKYPNASSTILSLESLHKYLYIVSIRGMLKLLFFKIKNFFFKADVNLKPLNIFNGIISAKRYKGFKDFDIIYIHRATNFLSIYDLDYICSIHKNVNLFLLDDAWLNSEYHYIPNFESIRNSFIYHITNYPKKIFYVDDEHEKIIGDTFFKNGDKSLLHKVVLPYLTRHKSNEILSYLNNRSISNDVNIVFGAIDFSYRKGVDLINQFINDLKILEVRIGKRIVLHVFGDRIDLKNDIKIINHGNLEKVIMNSNIFVSFSRIDTGPYIVNIAYELKLPIIGFGIGVMNDLKNEGGVFSNKIISVDHINNSIEYIIVNELEVLNDIKSRKSLVWNY